MKYTLLTLMLLMTGFCQAAIQPADGLWSTNDDPAVGSGLMLTTQGGITVVSMFTYDQDGNNAWYLASGQVDEEGVLEAELRQTQNGSNILNENPEAATFGVEVRTLRLAFAGTQIGILSIDGSAPKTIRSQHFGMANSYDFPDLTGQWLLANVESKTSYILDLVNESYLGPATRPPVFLHVYSSIHQSTEDWEIGCVISSFDPQSCFFNAVNSEQTLELRIAEQDIGNQSMTLTSIDGETKFQAFRLNKDRRLLPNDGHWRPADDPDVGSGIVMRTQGDYTLVLVYSYDAEGVPQWQIASGQFNEDGLFTAELLTPNEGTAIESSEPTSATFTESTQDIKIQLQGLELATFSIDGSVPKYIQNYNFGVDLFDTENIIINDDLYLFPNQVGQWTFTYYDAGELKAGILELIDGFPIFSPTPPGAPPYYYASLDHLFDNGSFMNLVCPGIMLQGYANSCYGNARFDDDVFDIKVNFQDIGFNQFRMHSISSIIVSDNSNLLEFFRLAD